MSDPARPDDPDDALLAALGAVARDQEAALDALPDDDDALRPPEGVEADALFDAAFGALMGGAAATASTEPEAAPVVAAADDDDAADADDALPAPLPFPGPRRQTPPPSRTRWYVGAALAAAAAVVLGVFLTRGPAPLPEYSLVAGAGDQALRADPVPDAVGRARYSPGARVTLLARPSADVQGPVAARLYLRVGDQDTPLAVPIEVSPKGAVRLDTVVGEGLTLPVGDGALVLLIVPQALGGEDRTWLTADDPRPARRLVHPFHYAP